MGLLYRNPRINFATDPVDPKVTKESLVEAARYSKTPAGKTESAAWRKNQYDIAADVLPFEEILKIAPNAKLLGVDKKNRPVYSGMDDWEAYQIATKQKNPFIIDEGKGYSSIYTHSPTKGASGKPLTVPQSGSPFMDTLEFIGTPVSWGAEIAGAGTKALGDVTGVGLLEKGGQTIQDIGRDDRVRQILGAAALTYGAGAALNAATPAATAAGTTAADVAAGVGATAGAEATAGLMSGTAGAAGLAGLSGLAKYGLARGIGNAVGTLTGNLAGGKGAIPGGLPEGSYGASGGGLLSPSNMPAPEYMRQHQRFELPRKPAKTWQDYAAEAKQNQKGYYGDYLA